MTAADTLARILSLRVDLRDEKACAEITPEMANAYLGARGWKGRGQGQWYVWESGDRQVLVPHEQGFHDYGRRMVELLGVLAAAEKRSPLAVWVDMMAQKETAA